MRNRISEILEEKGMKKSTFADFTGIARQNVNLILSQKQLSISYENIQKICDVLDVEVAELFESRKYCDYMIVDVVRAKVWSINERWTSREDLMLALKKQEAKELCESFNEEEGQKKFFALPTTYFSRLTVVAEHRPKILVKKYYPKLLNLWKSNKRAGVDKTVIKGSVNDFQNWFLDDESGSFDNSRFRGYVLKSAIERLEEEYPVKCTLETIKKGWNAVGYRLEILEGESSVEKRT